MCVCVCVCVCVCERESHNVLTLPHPPRRHYSFLNDYKTLGKVIEYGAGGYTQTRNILERHAIEVEHVTLVDPLIRQYAKLEGCSYEVQGQGHADSGQEANSSSPDNNSSKPDCWASTTYTNDVTEKVSCALPATLTVNSSMTAVTTTDSSSSSTDVPHTVVPVQYAATTINCSVEAFGRRYVYMYIHIYTHTYCLYLCVSLLYSLNPLLNPLWPQVLGGRHSTATAAELQTCNAERGW